MAETLTVSPARWESIDIDERAPVYSALYARIDAASEEAFVAYARGDELEGMRLQREVYALRMAIAKLKAC